MPMRRMRRIARRRSPASRCGIRSSRSTDRLVRHALRRRPRHREVPRRHVDGRSRHAPCRPCRGPRRCPNDHHTRISTSSASTRTRTPEAVAAALRQRPDVEYAQPAYRVARDFVPNDQYYKELQWNLPLHRSGACVGHPAGRPARRSPSPCSTRASRYTNAAVRFSAQRLSGRPGAPASGRLATSDAQLRRPRPSWLLVSRFVAPHDFIWDDNVPLDLDGHGTHVSGTIGQLTNNGARHGRRGLQRQADAGQGDRQRRGTTSSARRTRGPTTSSRAGSGMRPTTAPRSST